MCNWVGLVCVRTIASGTHRQMQCVQPDTLSSGPTLRGFFFGPPWRVPPPDHQLRFWGRRGWVFHHPLTWTSLLGQQHLAALVPFTVWMHPCLCSLPCFAIPTTNGGMQNGSSVGIRTRRVHVFARVGADLYAQSVLNNKISASELSRQFI